jgi:hypothetical protein
VEVLALLSLDVADRAIGRFPARVSLQRDLKKPLGIFFLMMRMALTVSHRATA